MKIEVIEGDITKLKVEAIVNPANSYMFMGGGLSLAIKLRGGPAIELEARKKAPVAVGDAIVTDAGMLPCKYIIHAPTMERPAMRIPVDNVKLAIEAALRCAAKHEIRELAIPMLGTGVGGLSYSEAARAIITKIKQVKPALKILLVGYTEEQKKELEKALASEL